MHKIQSSMNAKIYATQMVLNGRRTDSMRTPVLFQLGQLMWRGMSEHLLVEITHYSSQTTRTYLTNNYQFLMTLQG
jgi:hypothetical protein